MICFGSWWTVRTGLKDHTIDHFYIWRIKNKACLSYQEFQEKTLSFYVVGVIAFTTNNILQAHDLELWLITV